MQRHLLLLSTGAVAVVLALLASQSSSAQKKGNYWGIDSFAEYVTIPGATRLGSESCAGCHADTSSNFGHAFHAQQGIECEDCHGNGSLHVESAGDATKIISFSKRKARDANGACLSCHAQDDSVRHWMAGPHASNSIRCVDCHQVHGGALRAANEHRLSFDTSTRGALLAGSVSPETNVILQPMSATNDACLKCHQTEGAQLSLPYHHPLREGKMSCEDCHDPHGGLASNNLRASNVNQLCLTCHAQYRGPFAYQHPPVAENCMLCHTAHGSPNTNLLSVSEPALCLQCHAGHHDGASLPLADRCTNCHASIHGTDVPTPSGGSRFVDKGPSERNLRFGDPPSARLASHATVSPIPRSIPSHASTYAVGAVSGALGMFSSFGGLAPLLGGTMQGGTAGPADTEAEARVSSVLSFTPGAYRFIHGSGFLGRVGEYDSLQESAGTDALTAYVSTRNHLTVVSRANVLANDDYQIASQLTAGQWAQIGFDMRSFVQQQDHYSFYAFPVLDIPVGGMTPPDTTTDLIPSGAIFGVRRRLGNAYARVKVPKLPVHLFVNGNWQARAGETQFAYLDENTLPITAAMPCGFQCHFQSQFQRANYTTRNVGGGFDVKLHQMILRWEHSFSSFNDRLLFPIGTFTGQFTPEAEGISSINLPPSGPFPPDVPIGNYAIDPISPNQASSDHVSLDWAPSGKLSFNGNASYSRLRDLFTHYPQNSFDSDETLNWRATDRLRVTADYHQQNVINRFTPYYSMYGNISYHDHGEGWRLEYELPRGFDAEGYYQHGGITRSNSVLWQQTSANIFGLPSQIYSIDNTDLLKVVPSSTSNTAGGALRYHDGDRWSARAGYEWTGTDNSGYLVVPRSNNRLFADLTLTPTRWLIFANDISVILQDAFPAVPLLRPDGNGVSGNFQRHNRFYFETASATVPVLSEWNLGLGYSYQHNNLTTYMAFQNLPNAGYFLDEPTVPYKQITQAYWGESTYTIKRRLRFNLRVTYNSARSGMRPDVNPADAAKLGNAALIPQGNCDTGAPQPCFSPSVFSAALGNVEFSATKISQVIVPEWIGQSKGFYLFPRKFEGGLIFYYGSYRDYWNPNLNGVLRTFNVYVGRSW